MSEVIIYTQKISPHILIRESFSSHLKASKITFSLLLPVFIDLEKQLQKKEFDDPAVNNVMFVREIRDAIKKRSGKWLSGVLACCLHTVVALVLSRMENMACKRVVFLYRLHPKLSPFYVQKIIKLFLPKSLSHRFFKKTIVDNYQKEYIMYSPNKSLGNLGQRFLDSILRRGIYVWSELTVQLIGKNISPNLLTQDNLAEKCEHPSHSCAIKYTMLYHGGALFAGSLGGFFGYLYASNEGEYWGEMLGSLLWMKWLQGIRCE